MSQIIKNKINNSFAKPIVFFGILELIVSVPLIVKSPILAIILLFVGLFLSTSSYGSELDIAKGKYREYGSAFWIKSGKWYELKTMPFLGILKNRSGYKIYSRSNRSTSDLDDCYEVCLLSDTHRKRVVIQEFDSIEKASAFAKKLEEILNIKLTEFNPVLSEKTRSRRK